MADSTNTPNSQDTAAEEVDEAREQADAPAQDTTGDQEKQDDLPDDVDKLKALVRAARREAGKDRVNAKTKAADEAREQLVQQLGRALGLITDDKETPSVDDLTGRLTAQQAETRAAQVQVAVYRATSGKAIDVDALLDSHTFTTSLADLDPADTQAIQAHVDAFVKDNPRFKLTQAVGASTVEHAAGSGESKTRPANLTAAIAARLGG